MNDSTLAPRQILFVCNGPGSPGSHQRVSHILKALAATGDVTLVYPAANGQFGPELKELSSLCKKVFTFPIESLTGFRDLRLPKPVQWMKHKLRYLHPSLPAFMQQGLSAEGSALVAAICSRPLDLVWAVRMSSIPMLPVSLKSRVIVDLDDLEHRKLRWQLRLRKIHHMTPLYWLEYLKLRKVERALHLFPYEFTVCSETDKNALGAGSRVWVIPNGTDLPPSETVNDQDDEQEGPILVFVGFMSYSPNIDAVLYFHRNILPLIQREVPDVRFYIVGKNPERSVQQLHNGKSVMVTGTVPDVAPYLRSAVAAVAPLRWGGGTRIKILEAMAHRKPVVSTSVGAEGLEVQSGKHLLIADSPVAFAEACVALLKDAPLRRRLSDEGFKLIVDRYQWSTIEQTVREMVGDAVPAGRPIHEKIGSPHPIFGAVE